MENIYLGFSTKFIQKLFIIVTFQLCKHWPIDIHTMNICTYSSFQACPAWSVASTSFFSCALSRPTQKYSCALLSNSNQAIFCAPSSFFQPETRCRFVVGLYASRHTSGCAPWVMIKTQSHCGWTTFHGKCPMYDHDTLRIRICDALFTACYILCTNAPPHLRSKACLSH